MDFPSGSDFGIITSIWHDKISSGYDVVTS